MEKIDGRRLKQEVRQALRGQVVRLRKHCRMNKDAAEFLGISPRHAGTIRQRYVTPLLGVRVKKVHISMISAITNEGKVRFMIYREAMTQAKVVTFMGRLARDTGRKVYLILDNLKTHHGKKVAEWLEIHKDEIAVFYLPSYSPEMNPDE